MTIVTACCAIAVAASVLFTFTANNADATSDHDAAHANARVLADAALADALVPVATPDGTARDPQGRAMATHFAITTQQAQRAAQQAVVQQAAAQAATAQAAIALAAANAQAARVRSANDAVWDRLARCETGGNWGLRGARFSGGLGIYNGTWAAFGGRQFAPNAGLATRDQQIVVAERIRARYGYTGWGCAPHVGLGRSTMH